MSDVWETEDLMDRNRGDHLEQVAGLPEVEACPCKHIMPCHPRCSCMMPLSSSGCWRCCSYGSKEQQRLMAEKLASRIDNHLTEGALRDKEIAACHKVMQDAWAVLNPIVYPDICRELSRLLSDDRQTHGACGDAEVNKEREP